MNALQSSLRPMILGAAVLAVLPVSAAHAALYGNLTGPNVSYTNINESDNQIIGLPIVNSTPTGLFGAPVLSPVGSDDVAFPSLTFSTLVADGEFEEQDGTLRMNLAPTSSSVFLHSLVVDEGGGFRLQGPDFAQDPSDASLDEATLVFSDVRITSLNGITLPTPIVVAPTFFENVVTQTGADHFTATNGDTTIVSGGGTAVGTWEIAAQFDFDAALAAANASGDQITGISMDLDNELYSQTTEPDGGVTLASIDKKHFYIEPVTTTTNTPPLPEPASVSVLLIGMAGLMARRRRMA